jgi:hypothetical protein
VVASKHIPRPGSRRSAALLQEMDETVTDIARSLGYVEPNNLKYDPHFVDLQYQVRRRRSVLVACSSLVQKIVFGASVSFALPV